MLLWAALDALVASRSTHRVEIPTPRLPPNLVRRSEEVEPIDVPTVVASHDAPSVRADCHGLYLRFDDNAQIAFEVERSGNNVVVYIPGAPNPWSGSVAYFNVERVKRLDMSVSQTISSIKRIGHGSAGYGELDL